MAPTNSSTTHYQYLVIGGGSGGVASARRAGKYGAKTLLIESSRMGGTCVNVGCVPKKIMWSAATMAKSIEEAAAYGFDVKAEEAHTFHWPEFKAKRDAYIKRLNGIYERNLTNDGVEWLYGKGKFLEPSKASNGETIHRVEVALRDGSTKVFTADNVLVATGGAPLIPPKIEGAELGITSDGFFELETQPKKVAIVGAGYIGVELAGVFNGLNTETHLFIRGETVLRAFDDSIGSTITELYEKHGVHVHKKEGSFKKIEKTESGKLLITKADGSQDEFDELIWTIGRYPLTDPLDLAKVGLKVNEKGFVVVNEWQESNVKGIYSLGDVVGHVELTPVAIATGRKLSNRLFGPEQFKSQKQSFENIPSVIFSHPEAGSIGLSEKEAIEKYGKDKIKVYKSKFISMYYAPMEADQKDPTLYKIVTLLPEEKVVGLHLVGDSSAEILQGFGVAIKMGATKADFDSCVAIHPTAAEELVTMT